MEAKTLLAIAGPHDAQVTASVQLNGVIETERLTPKMARQAARIAFGHCHRVTVWDWEGDYGYRLYAKSARKITGDAPADGD